MTGLNGGELLCGDYDADGDPDILSSREGSVSIYVNQGDGTFHSMTAHVPGMSRSATAGGLRRRRRSGHPDHRPRGIAQARPGVPPGRRSLRHAPSAPTGLGVVPGSGRIILRWDAATDAESTATALSYNLRVGTTPGGSEICSPLSNPDTGFRRIVRDGDAGQHTSRSLTLPADVSTVYWSVQAVDASYMGSTFSPEMSASTLPANFAEIATGLPAVAGGGAAWGDADGDGDLDLLLWGVLNPGLAERLDAADGLPDLGALRLSPSEIVANVYRNDGDDVFTDVGADLTGVVLGAAAWGDCDGDGDLDILAAGYSSAGRPLTSTATTADSRSAISARNSPASSGARRRGPTSTTTATSTPC